MTSLERRIKSLEAATATGCGGCERCAGTTVATTNGNVHSVTKRGRRFPQAEAVAFVAEEGPGRVCPVCGNHRRKVASVGGPVPSR